MIVFDSKAPTLYLGTGVLVSFAILARERFEIGHFTQTQSSWTVHPLLFRKWMSGQAAALVSPNNRSPLDTVSALSEDHGWMSPACSGLMWSNHYHARKSQPLFAKQGA